MGAHSVPDPDYPSTRDDLAAKGVSWEDTAQLLGRSLEDAQELASRWGMTVRKAAGDRFPDTPPDVEEALTADFRPSRLNVEWRAGGVTRVLGTG